MLDKCKIRVNNEADSKEAKELLFELGCTVVNHIDAEKGFIVASKGATSPLNFDYWCCVENELTLSQLRDLVAQNKKEQGLISGADALRALADGKEVEFFYRDVWDSIGEMIVIDHFTNDKFKFRLKPSTVKIELEIPAPFEPKVGEKYWFIADYTSHGYSDTQEGTGINSSIGKWKSEDEVKQVVAALRQIFGGV